MYKSKPKHDDSSHASDAFRYLATAVLPMIKQKDTLKTKERTYHNKITGKIQRT